MRRYCLHRLFAPYLLHRTSRPRLSDPDASSSHVPSEYSETERQIFGAALREFARKGKDGTRMQSIADAAGINKAMLHYYFRSKDQLYADVFDHTVHRFMASFGESLQDAPTFEETLRAFIEGYISFVQRNEAAMRLMITENLSGGTLLAEHLQQMKRQPGTPPEVMIRRIEDAAAAGTIRSVDPHHTMLSVISTCLFFFAMRPTVQFIHPDASDWNTFVADRADHIFDLVYHGLAPRPAGS